MGLLLTNYRPYRGDLAPKTIVDSDYEVDSVVGQGAFSTVYKARQLSKNGRLIALKVLHSGIQQSLVRRNPLAPNPYKPEQELTARIPHPAFCQTYQVGRTMGGRWYAASEWVEGETLKTVIRQRPQGLPLILVADIVQQLGQALSAMHKVQVVHRDLKPANLMLEIPQTGEPFTRLRVLDFGLARLAGNEGEDGEADHLLAGTPAYMSPEQVRNGPVDPRSDIFSAGTVAYELLTGKRPMRLEQRFSSAEEYVRYLESEKPIPTVAATSVRPGLPDDVDDIFEQALARERHRRYPTIEMLCDDLEIVLRAHIPSAGPSSLLERALDRLGRRNGTGSGER